MKVYIVFIALLVLNATFITYQGDMNRYVRFQNYIKAVAEDAASGAALYYDEKDYSLGIMSINREEAMKYIAMLTSQAEEKLKLGDEDSLAVDMVVLDHNSKDNKVNDPPSVTVTIKLTKKGLFRLPFITRDEVIRSAKYELAEY